ncbi:hypothetical protein M3193_06965 [Sporosarcina luteola]|uniref:hypothetical protein n=1 Tax=Sporosarcina luteola TaxID=582850 RepID=UPI00203B3F73|nr:hypothetical protein [Sporosarcina luteola]MCM3743880.1 hypothetical protein [Sporosarcina luteola]
MLEIHDTSSALNTFLEMDVFNNDTKKRVIEADIVLLPNFEVAGGVDRAFQPDTVSFYKYSIANKGNELKFELLENKGEEKTLALHSFDIWIPFIYIGSTVLLPLTINLVSSFVYDKMKGRPNDEPTVHFDLLVEDKEKGKSKHLSYKGSAKDFKKSFEKIDVNKLWED